MILRNSSKRLLQKVNPLCSCQGIALEYFSIYHSYDGLNRIACSYPIN